MNREMIIILDFGGQYNQLIARRVREHHVYCEIMPWNKPIEEIKAKNPKGIIFTGGPNSVYDEKSPHCDPEIFELGVPVLGICYGCQLMAYTLGGKVGNANEKSEYGKTEVTFDTESKLMKGIDEKEIQTLLQKCLKASVLLVRQQHAPQQLLNALKKASMAFSSTLK